MVRGKFTKLQDIFSEDSRSLVWHIAEFSTMLLLSSHYIVSRGKSDESSRSADSTSWNSGLQGTVTDRYEFPEPGQLEDGAGDGSGDFVVAEVQK